MSHDEHHEIVPNPDYDGPGQHCLPPDVKDWPAHDSEFIQRGLSAIEDYEATDQGYSFVGVSVNGTHRIRVTDGSVEQ